MDRNAKDRFGHSNIGRPVIRKLLWMTLYDSLLSWTNSLKSSRISAQSSLIQ